VNPDPPWSLPLGEFAAIAETRFASGGWRRMRRLAAERTERENAANKDKHHFWLST
jgi:hypothetical protein